MKIRVKPLFSKSIAVLLVSVLAGFSSGIILPFVVKIDVDQTTRLNGAEVCYDDSEDKLTLNYQGRELININCEKDEISLLLDSKIVARILEDEKSSSLVEVGYENVTLSSKYDPVRHSWSEADINAKNLNVE